MCYLITLIEYRNRREDCVVLFFYTYKYLVSILLSWALRFGHCVQLMSQRARVHENGITVTG